MERINRFLEDQPPLIRTNIRMGVVVLITIVTLHVVLTMAVRVLDSSILFQFDVVLRALRTLLFLMLILLSFNALKAVYHTMRGQGVFTAQGSFFAIAAVIIMLLSTLNMPSLFQKSVTHAVGRSYDEIYTDFDQLCSAWEIEWADATAVTLRPDEEDLGRLGEEVEVFKLQSTILFNFSQDEEVDFGFACALRGQSPSDIGRARHYGYFGINDAQYQFLEDVRR